MARNKANKMVDKIQPYIHEQASKLLGLIHNNSSIDSFISLYVLPKYTHFHLIGTFSTNRHFFGQYAPFGVSNMKGYDISIDIF